MINSSQFTNDKNYFPPALNFIIVILFSDNVRRHHRPILVAPSRVHKWCAESVHRGRNRHCQLCEGLRVRRRELIAGHELSTRICQLDSANFLVSLYESRISVHRPQRLHSAHFVECYWYCENFNATIHVFVYWTVLYLFDSIRSNCKLLPDCSDWNCIFEPADCLYADIGKHIDLQLYFGLFWSSEHNMQRVQLHCRLLDKHDYNLLPCAFFSALTPRSFHRDCIR